jgi:carbonic anhydrase
MSLIDDILNKQKTQNFSAKQEVPEHKPEMLLIGCVDARKDPISDLGIEKGKALILRNLAALIRGISVAASQRETEAAALEFAVKVVQVKHIVAMGHTDCGGIRACMMDVELTAIKNYLSPLN